MKEINAQCVGGSELNAEKVKLQTLSEETHALLKKNVFQHYRQFIDTAKDISCELLFLWLSQDLIFDPANIYAG